MENGITISEAYRQLDEFMEAITTYGYRPSTTRGIKIVIKHYLREISNEFLTIDIHSLAFFMKRYSKETQKTVFNFNLESCLKFHQFLNNGCINPAKKHIIWKARDIFPDDHFCEYTETFHGKNNEQTISRRTRAILLFLCVQRRNGVKFGLGEH